MCMRPYICVHVGSSKIGKSVEYTERKAKGGRGGELLLISFFYLFLAPWAATFLCWSFWVSKNRFFEENLHLGRCLVWCPWSGCCRIPGFGDGGISFPIGCCFPGLLLLSWWCYSYFYSCILLLCFSRLMEYFNLNWSENCFFLESNCIGTCSDSAGNPCCSDGFAT